MKHIGGNALALSGEDESIALAKLQPDAKVGHAMANHDLVLLQPLSPRPPDGPDAEQEHKSTSRADQERLRRPSTPPDVRVRAHLGPDHARACILGLPAVRVRADAPLHRVRFPLAQRRVNGVDDPGVLGPGVLHVERCDRRPAACSAVHQRKATRHTLQHVPAVCPLRGLRRNLRHTPPPSPNGRAESNLAQLYALPFT
eukprot:1650921-Rhodomonas_salina.8